VRDSPEPRSAILRDDDPQHDDEGPQRLVPADPLAEDHRPGEHADQRREVRDGGRVRRPQPVTTFVFHTYAKPVPSTPRARTAPATHTVRWIGWAAITGGSASSAAAARPT
jgi:hypothetical protein